jgi:tyrosyl-tRNA synthetase
MTSGLDQRKLFIAAKEWLPKIGYKQVCPNLMIDFLALLGLTASLRAHLLNPMVAGLTGGKMVRSISINRCLMETNEAIE